MNFNSIKNIKSLEIFLGFVVILFVSSLIWKFSSNIFASVALDEDENYYYASFSDIDGLTVGSDVKIGGISVGKLIAYEIDEKYKIIAKLSVSKKYKISDDSSVMVATSGFIGQKYLKLSPGFGDETLQNGDEILLTQSSLNVESLLALLKK